LQLSQKGRMQLLWSVWREHFCVDPTTPPLQLRVECAFA